MAFQKGQSGNPAGRPAGSSDKRTSVYKELKKIAAEDSQYVYKKVKAAMEAGEAWAFQLWYKYHAPVNINQEVQSIELPKDISGPDDIIEALIKGLAKFEDFSQEEILNALKTLNSVKVGDKIAKEEITLTDLYTDDELIEFKARLDKKMKEKDNNE